MRQPAEPEPAPFARRGQSTSWAAAWSRRRGTPGRWVVGVVRVAVADAGGAVVAVQMPAARVAGWDVVHWVGDGISLR